MKNLAFIDGQNLYMGVVLGGWKVDYKRFRVYLKDKYNVEKAYYFMGFFLESEQKLYKKLKDSGFILIFKKHNKEIQSKKKGNVDVDIVFNIMQNLLENHDFNQIILVSGDGDYFSLVDYLIQKDRFCKILFPNTKFASSLYQNLGSEYFDYLTSIRKFVEYK